MVQISCINGDLPNLLAIAERQFPGAVTKLDSGEVQLNHFGFIPDKGAPEKIEVLSSHTSNLLDTAVHNLLDDDQEPRFQRQVTYNDMPESVVKEFQKYSHDKSLDLLREFDRWLANKKKSVDPDSEEEKSQVGVGIYFFNNEKDD